MHDGDPPNQRVDQQIENIKRLLLAVEEATEELENDADNSQTIANYKPPQLMELTTQQFVRILKERLIATKPALFADADAPIEKSVLMLMNNSGRTRLQELDVDEVSLFPP